MPQGNIIRKSAYHINGIDKTEYQTKPYKEKDQDVFENLYELDGELITLLSSKLFMFT